MRALRGTGRFAQRGDVLGCNCRCLHDGRWPLRHRREKRIGRGEDDDDLEQRHPCNSAIQLRWATDTELQMTREACDCDQMATSSSCRAATAADIFDASASQERDRTMFTLAYTHTSVPKHTAKVGALAARERAAASSGKSSNSYKRATNQQRAARCEHNLTHPAKKAKKVDKKRRAPLGLKQQPCASKN